MSAKSRRAAHPRKPNHKAKSMNPDRGGKAVPPVEGGSFSTPWRIIAGEWLKSGARHAADWTLDNAGTAVEWMGSLFTG